MRPIVSAVLRSLLRLQSIPSNRKDGFVGAWLKLLDYLVAAAEADRFIDDQELLAAGIASQKDSEVT